MEYIEHPEWKDKYPAIDGISKPDRDFREYDMGGQSYSPFEKAVRSDIEKILEMPCGEFSVWYMKKKKSVETLITDYENFATIPNLGYGSELHKFDMTAITLVKNHLESLKQGLEYLEVIKQVRRELNLETDKPLD